MQLAMEEFEKWKICPRIDQEGFCIHLRGTKNKLAFMWKKSQEVGPYGSDH